MNYEAIVDRVTSKGVQLLIECIQQGCRDYDNPQYYTPEAKRDHNLMPGVASTCRNCHIIARAKRMTVEMQEFVKIKQSRGRVTFILADHTEIWFKKLDKAGKPSFRVSQQALEYIEPPKVQPTLDIDIPAEKARWVAGYRSSSIAGTEFEVLVSGPKETGEWWEVRLSGTEIQELFPTPTTAPIPAATEVIKKRVKVRKPKETKAIGSDFDV